MSPSLKQKMGALCIDVPFYVYLLFCRKIQHGHAWMLIRNRHEHLALSQKPFGIHCQWQWTSDLYLPKIFPLFGRILFAKTLTSFNFDFNNHKRVAEPATQSDVSFIIGHRGITRASLLLKTIDSIAAQQGCNIECIVVEQDDQETVKDLLPAWVNYVFSPPEEKNMAYSRAQAFNVGAQHASSNCLIFHDNDLLIPNNYAYETLQLVLRGFDFVNLKRFIFYLSEESTHSLLKNKRIESDLTLESIMQNAEGGGSIGASRKGYSEIGGFDERFIGWGGEDNEFWERAQTTNIWPFGSLPLIHLWHGAQTGKLDIENSETTLLYKKLSQNAAHERIQWLKQHQVIKPIDNKGNH